MISKMTLPTHVGIIMDGNRRWAKEQGLALLKGHEYVVDRVVENLIERCGELGIKHLTLWVFSTDNWQRDVSEVNGLMQLFRTALKTKVARFIAKGAKLRMIGDIQKFAPDIREGMEQAMKASEKNDKITVTFALNYGGRDEILRAVAKMQGTEVSEAELARHLDTAGMPDPDLIIRTGGDQRLSGFMAWQAVYSELYFTNTLMPDFGVAQLDEALEEFGQRQRRYGK